MQIAGTAPVKRYRIVGIAKFGCGQSFGGASTAILTPQEAQRIVGEQGHFDTIYVAAQPGITATSYAIACGRRCPRTVHRAHGH